MSRNRLQNSSNHIVSTTSLLISESCIGFNYDSFELCCCHSYVNDRNFAAIIQSMDLRERRFFLKMIHYQRIMDARMYEETTRVLRIAPDSLFKRLVFLDQDAST